jgi:uncharacterized protein (TIGR02594 family)
MKTKCKSCGQSINDVAWIAIGRSYLGLKEIRGSKHNQTIMSWIKRLKGWFTNDETPWCGTYVANCLVEAGQPIIKHWYRARAWAEWGAGIDNPCYGCIVVFKRGGGGHVGFVVGLDQQGRLMVLGGNQGNQVSIAPFDKSRVLAYRVPKGFDVAGNSLATMLSQGESSTNEA